MGRKFRFTPHTGGVLVSALALPAVIAWASTSGAASAPPKPTLDQQFTRTVQPFVQNYCAPCHGKDKPQAQLDLTSYATRAAVARGLPHWTLAGQRIAAKEMPPSGFGKQPSAKERAAVVAWIQAVRADEVRRNAGDPGPVLARRLSNSEYDYTIRDLTGVDLRPTREFPVDPANQEGFDNSGESLTFSPALTKKYAEAAREIADHLVLTSTGLTFATHPVIAETDRDKFCVLRIVDFYHKQPTDLADYFRAAWRFRHRAALGEPTATLTAIAAREKVSPKYLGLIWKTLTAPGEAVGPIATLRTKWNALPGPEKGVPDCAPLRDWVTGLRRKIAWRFGNIKVPGEFSTGGYCNILWKDRLYATHRRDFNPSLLQIGGTPAQRRAPVKGNALGGVRGETPTITDPVDPDLFVPREEAQRASYLDSFKAFSSLFPDAFYIDERGLMESDGIYARSGRLLTGGTHNATSYFRDDAPLMELVLDDRGQKELDALWRDFAIVAEFNERMYLQGIFYERNEAQTILVTRDPEFNFARSEDRACASPEQIQRFADLYLAKARRKGATEETLAVFADYFKRSAENIRQEKRDRLAAEPVHRKALVSFAQKAFRRPLTAAERAGVLAFYEKQSKKEGMTHEEAVRDTVASILMSPHFLFRLDLEDTAAQRPGQSGVRPLSDHALASRLSYFLWSSLPDDELLAHAAAGDLHRPEVLKAQTHRMLQDPKVRAVAQEMFGNWLDFRRFEEHSAVDRERFPTFDDRLREAMFEEPIHFLVDGLQNNRSVLDLLYGKHTFVNGPLAKHYGIPGVTGAAWQRVDDAARYGRGGLLPMSVFLTKNASSLRTSPVRRGYWVVRRLLGEYIPPPPAVVPELPKDEKEMGELTLRQTLAKHRQSPACSGCHARFDSYGLVFEGYGPIGELRAKDLGGKPIDASAPFPGGVERTGVAGLQEFVRQQRQDDFLATLSRKMLSYGLGRSLQPSDDPTIKEMQRRLAANRYGFQTLVDTVVSSRAFRNRRASVTIAKD